MEIFRLTSVRLALLLIVGILLENWVMVSLPLTIGLVVVGLAALWAGQRLFPKCFAAAVILTTVASGMLVTALHNPNNRKNYFGHSIQSSQGPLSLKIVRVLKSNSYNHRYEARVLTVGSQPSSGKILLSQPKTENPLPLSVDTEIQALISLDSIAGPLNSHQFNYRQYMAHKGIFYQGYLHQGSFSIGANPCLTLYGRAAKLRATLLSKIKALGYDEAVTGVVQALLLGQRHDIPEDTYTAYKNAGAVHILALSGLHIGILLLLLQTLLSPLTHLPKGRTLRGLLIILCMWGFAFLSGLSPSIVRAVTMFSFLGYALWLNRPTNSINILALSLLAILWISPNMLFQLGLQMSYAAVLAIVLLYPKWVNAYKPRNIILKKGWQLLVVSAAAQLGVLPLALYHFHQFPSLFFIANLLIVPLLGLILGGGLLVLVLLLANIQIPLLFTCYERLIQYMNLIVGWVAEQEGFLFQEIPFNQLQLWLAYGGIIALVAYYHKRNAARLAVVLCCLIGFQAATLYSKYRASQQERLIIAQQTANTLLMAQHRNRLDVFTSDSIAASRIVHDFAVGERSPNRFNHPLANTYQFGSSTLFMVDSMGILPPETTQLDVVLLTQSPKINLDRWLLTAKPDLIIADGSNYHSVVARWKASCQKAKIPFHHTGERGFWKSDR